MLTLQQALADQEDLATLCAERLLKTGEIFQPNAFYGIDGVLKLYAGLPSKYSLKAIMPHGVFFDADYLWSAERTAELPMVLCYPSYRASVYRRRTNKKVVLSSSPFLYVVKMLQGQRSPDREGTIFFPQHSSHFVTAHYNFEGLANRLQELDEEFKPITVCIYWRDFNLGHHIPFQECGMKVVSAGHMYDPNFLYRLYHLFSLHRYAAGSGFGSHIFYAVKSGCRYFHLGGYPSRKFADKETLKRDTSNLPANLAVVIEKVFGLERPFEASAQQEIANYYLGAENMATPESLRRQLLLAELLDKVAFYLPDEGNKSGLAIPPYYRRFLDVTRRFISRARRRLSIIRDYLIARKDPM